MEHKHDAKRAILMWLILLSWFSGTGLYAQRTIKISTWDELRAALARTSAQTKANDSAAWVGDLVLDPEGILVDRLIEVKVKASISGGPLIRAEGYSDAIFDVQAGGDLTLHTTIDGQNVSSSSTVIIRQGGRFEMSTGARIINVVKARPMDAVVENYGTFEMTADDARIAKAQQNPSGVQLDVIPQYIYNATGANCILFRGAIEDGVQNYGSLSLYGSFQLSKLWMYAERYAVVVGSDAPQGEAAAITIESALERDLEISATSMAMNRGLAHGVTVAKGGANYILTESDMAHLKIGSWGKRLVNNEIIVVDSSQEDSGEIEDAADIQAAIDQSPDGSSSSTVVTIPEAGVELTETIVIPKGKRITLTGGMLKRAAGISKLCMIQINGGNLTLRDIRLDGNRASYEYPQGASIVRIYEGGYLGMEDGAILQNNTDGSDTTDKIGTVNVWDGSFVMNGGMISGNYGYHSIIEVGPEGSFLMRGGMIHENAGGGIIYNLGRTELAGGDLVDNLNVRNALIINGNGNPDANEGTLHIYNDPVISNPRCTIGGILNYSTLILEGGAFRLKDKITLHNDRVITLQSNLSQCEEGELHIAHQCDANFQLANNQLVAEGGSFTEETLSKITYEGDYQLVADGSRIYLSTGSATGGIRDRESLQAAIDSAATGSAAQPVVLNIPVAGINMDQTVTIKGKHIKLTGNGVRYINTASGNLRMFSVEGGGSLTIESGSMEGSAASNAYTTFVYVGSGASATLRNVTMTKAISDARNWSMLRIYGDCALENCSILSNSGEAMIFVGASGDCRIEGGRITGNSCSDGSIVNTLIYNLGALDYVSGEFTNNHAISLSSQGTTTLRSPQIKNFLSASIRDDGGAIWIYDRLLLHNTATIGDAFFLEQKSSTVYGRLCLTGALRNSVELVCHDAKDGWVAVEGSNYALTDNDLQKVVLTKSLAEEFKLVKENNTFVLRALKGKTYNVKTWDYDWGRLTTDKAVAAEGETVTVTVTPADGYHLYEERLRYNDVHKLQPTSGKNVFTFKMPAEDVMITAEFLPNESTVAPVDTTGFTPDDVIPDTGIGNLDSLIAILGGGDVLPEASPVPESELPGALADAVDDAKSDGDSYVGSLEELINILSPGDDTPRVLAITPVRMILIFHLPNSDLRAATSHDYYILNECQGKVTKIIPEYDEETRTLLFRTDRMGVFTVMRGDGSAVSNEVLTAEMVRAVAGNNSLTIYNLPVGEPYWIYDLSGRQVNGGVGNGATIQCRLNTAGVYVIKWAGNSLKVVVR